MLPINAQEKHRVLIGLSLFHILIIASSNYLVQLPINVLGFNATWGAFSFPFIFVATDLTVRIFGASSARQIIAIAMLPALFISYIVSVLFFEGAWTGWQTLLTINVFVVRIAIASFLAYVVGQLMDIYVFNRLRRLNATWIAPSAAAIVGNAVDTAVFFTTAFYKTDNAYLAEHLVEIAIVDYAFKVIICLLFFVPLYLVILTHIIKRITAPVKYCSS